MKLLFPFLMTMLPAASVLAQTQDLTPAAFRGAVT